MIGNFAAAVEPQQIVTQRAGFLIENLVLMLQNLVACTASPIVHHPTREHLDQRGLPCALVPEQHYLQVQLDILSLVPLHSTHQHLRHNAIMSLPQAQNHHIRFHFGRHRTQRLKRVLQLLLIQAQRVAIVLETNFIDCFAMAFVESEIHLSREML